jgi:hypothetical protein
VREGGAGGAGPGVGGPAEVDPAGLARGPGDRRCAAFGGGLLGVADAVKDGTDLGQQLSQVDGADPGQPAQELGPWVLGDPLLDRCLQLADGGLQAPQQLESTEEQLGPMPIQDLRQLLRLGMVLQ